MSYSRGSHRPLLPLGYDAPLTSMLSKEEPRRRSRPCNHTVGGGGRPGQPRLDYSPLCNLMTMMVMIMSMCETTSLNCGPKWYEHGEPLWECWQSKTPDSSTTALNPTSSHLVASRRNGWREWRIWPCEVFLFIPEIDVTCRKILWHGASGFTYPPKEGGLKIFIALGRLWVREPWV
jgi:hypothetical protein